MMGIDRHAAELPTVNTRVDVHGRWNRWVPSRVEDVADGRLLLAAPATADFEIQPRLGDRVVVQWITGRGVAQMTGAVETVRQENALRLWNVQVVEGPVVHQRRRYVRVPATLPVAIVRTTDEGVERVDGTTVDVSEGGIQVVTAPPSEVPKGAFVSVVVEIEGHELRVPGDVLQSRPRPEGGHAIVVRFLDVKETDADRIRRFVFSLQMTSLVREPR